MTPLPKITESDLREFYKKSREQQHERRLQQEMKDFLKDKPFRPLPERRAPSPVPMIARKAEQELRRRASEIALRIIKRSIPIVRFSSLLGDILDWLLQYFFRWAGRRAITGAWFPNGICEQQLPSVGPDKYNWSIGETTYNMCIVNQGFSSTLPNSLAEIPANGRSAVRGLQYNAIPRYQNAAGFLRKQIRLPWIIPNFELVDNWLPDVKFVPRPNVRQYLKPDWPALIEDRVPDPENIYEPPPRDPERIPEVPGKHVPDVKRPPTREYQFVFRPGERPQTVRQTYVRTRTRTRSGEKERKFQGSKEGVREIFRRVSQFKEGMSEYDDFLDNILDAMPKAIRDKLPKRNGRETPDLKARFIYDNWESVDAYKLAENLVKNYLQDKAVGIAIDYSDRSARVRGELTNLSTRGSWLHTAIGVR